MNILIIGPKGAGKALLAQSLSRALDATCVSERDIRTDFNDWDNSPAGVWRLGVRLTLLSKEVKEYLVIEASSLPSNFSPDNIIFMDTLDNTLEVPKKAIVVSTRGWWKASWVRYWTKIILDNCLSEF